MRRNLKKPVIENSTTKAMNSWEGLCFVKRVLLQYVVYYSLSMKVFKATANEKTYLNVNSTNN